MASKFEVAEHPALGLAVAERHAYLTLLGSMVLADAKVDDRELAGLERLGTALELPGGTAGRALADARALDNDGTRVLARKFRDYFVRQQLLTDAIVISFADGVLDATEKDKIAALADNVGLSARQAAMIGRYVEQYLGAPDQTPELRAKLGDELATGLGAMNDAPETSGVFAWVLAKICPHRSPK